MTEPAGKVIEVEGLRPVVSYPREAVLEIEHVALALGISKRTAERKHFKCFYIGPKTRRFIWGEVLDECARMSA